MLPSLQDFKNIGDEVNRLRLAPQASGVGVVIGRFQVPTLTPAHRQILRHVEAAHSKLVVMLGVTPAKGAKRNPLDFQSRLQAVRGEFPQALIIPVFDQPTDAQWSALVDQTLLGLFGKEKITLYGGRDCFLPHYKGQLHTVQIDISMSPSGSEVRRQAASEPMDSAAFRAGVIYHSENVYTRAFQTVDVVIIDAERDSFLMARKESDPQGEWRFIGGFVDPTDKSLEAAASREAFEETGGLGIGRPMYIGSCRIDDWRYRGGPEAIMTAVFVARRLYGLAKASDDIAEVRWLPSANVPGVVAPMHRPIWDLVKPERFVAAA